MLGLAAALGLGMHCNTARADYLSSMENNANPSVLVEFYYTIAYTANNSFTLTGNDGGSNGTMIDIMSGNSNYSSGLDDPATISISITLGANNTIKSGSLTETVTVNSVVKTLFSSNDPVGFGVNPAGGISYWFAFQETGGSFYTANGQIVGGLVTTSEDVKEYPMAPTPLPNSAAGAGVLLAGLAGFGVYRRIRSRSTQPA